MFGGENFVLLHTAISLIGLVLGVPAVLTFWASRRRRSSSTAS